MMDEWYKQFGPAGPTPSEPSESVVRARFRNPKPKKPPKPKPIRTDIEAAARKIWDYLDRAGAATRSDLQRNLWRYVDTQTLGKVLYILVESKGIEIVKSENKELYRIAPFLRGQRIGAKK